MNGTEKLSKTASKVFKSTEVHFLLDYKSAYLCRTNPNTVPVITELIQYKSCIKVKWFSGRPFGNRCIIFLILDSLIKHGNEYQESNVSWVLLPTAAYPIAHVATVLEIIALRLETIYIMA